MNLKAENKVLIAYIVLLLIIFAIVSGNIPQIKPSTIGWLCIPFLPVIIFTMCRDSKRRTK